MQESRYHNTILKALEEESCARLQLRRIEFKVGQEIEYPGQAIAHMVFVEEGMASMTTTFQNGSQVEVGMFGYESVIGVSALMGTKQSLNRVYTQIDGYGYQCTVEAGKAEFDRGERFQALALRYVQAQLVQAAQSAGCNAKHNFEQRLARWLLLCADRAHRDSFKISQEFLADMLGGTRPTVTVSAAVLREKNLIEYRRGTIQILDPAGLERVACECYHVIKAHLNNYAEFDTGITK